MKRRLLGEAAASQTAVNVGQCMKDHRSMCALIDWIINIKCENITNASDLAKRVGQKKQWLSKYRNGQRDRLELTHMWAFLTRSFPRIGLPTSIPADAASLGGSGNANPARAADCVQPIPWRSMAIAPSSRSISQPRDRIRGGRCRSFALRLCEV